MLFNNNAAAGFIHSSVTKWVHIVVHTVNHSLGHSLGQYMVIKWVSVYVQTNCTIFVFMCECCLCVVSDVLCDVLFVCCVLSCVVCVSGRRRMSPRVSFSRNNGFVWLC